MVTLVTGIRSVWWHCWQTRSVWCHCVERPHTFRVVSLCWKTHFQDGVTVLKDTLSGWCHCVERHTFRMVSLCWKTYIQDGVTVLIDTRSALCHCVERHTFSTVALLTDIRLVWWEYSERHKFSMATLCWHTHVQRDAIDIYCVDRTRATWCHCWQEHVWHVYVLLTYILLTGTRSAWCHWRFTRLFQDTTCRSVRLTLGVHCTARVYLGMPWCTCCRMGISCCVCCIMCIP